MDSPAVAYPGPLDPRGWSKGRGVLGLYVYCGRSGIDPTRWLPRAGRGLFEMYAHGRHVGVCWPAAWPLQR